uniref:Uncharacterized protein n=1 Tax=Equus caballus TaxID=9796 RepID=A0A9L0SAC5_HORSE
MAGSYGNSMFKFLRDCHTVFHSSCTILHSYQQSTSIPISPHLHQHLRFSILWVVPILMAVKWHLIVVLICVSLMTSDVEHLFMCLLAIGISPLEKCLLKFFAHLLIGLFV